MYSIMEIRVIDFSSRNLDDFEEEEETSIFTQYGDLTEEELKALEESSAIVPKSFTPRKGFLKTPKDVKAAMEQYNI